MDMTEMHRAREALRKKEEETRRLNQELEQRVKERTADVRKTI